jgi:hypothetical protein
LHHEVKSSSLYQAGSGKALESTFIERKQMSTKTSIKRIALVAVSALGFGLMSVVTAPVANAAAVAPTTLTVGTVAPARAGVDLVVPVTAAFATSGASDTLYVVAKVLTAPTGSVLAGASTNVNSAGAYLKVGASTNLTASVGANNPYLEFYGGITNPSGTTDAQAGESFTVTASKTSAIANLTIKPDIAGTYTIMISTNDGTTEAKKTYAAGDVSTSFSFTTAGTPTAITFTRINATAGEGTGGSLTKVTFKDAAGNATIPGLNEAFSVTDDSSDVTTTEVVGTDAVISSGDMANGFALIRTEGGTVSDDVTSIVTVTGSGLIPATLTSNYSVTIRDNDYATSAIAVTTTTTGYESALVAGVAGKIEYNTSNASHGLTLTHASVAAAATGYTSLSVIDPSGINGWLSGSITYTLACAVAGTATAAVTSSKCTVAAAPTTTKSILVFPTGTTDNTQGIGFGTAAGVQTTVTADLASVRLATGGSVTLSATVKNQYGVVMANTSVNASITGRNATTASTPLVSDANGQVSFKVTDGATATGTSSTVTFAGAVGGSGSTTITWGDVAVSTITATGGNTTAGVTAATVSSKDISAGDGAEAGAQTLSAILKDANGSLLSGVAVTWSVTGDGVAIPTNNVTTYTDANGKASSSVYAWKAGTYTYMASAGGKEGTGTITFAQTAAGEERTLSGSVSGSIITAKVVDRFGNPVPGVTVYASKTGDGYFGTGVTKTSTTTSASGEAEFSFTGAATVKLSTISYDAVAGTFGSGQTSAPKGYLGNSTTAAGLAALALTPSVAGTTLAAEEYVGASFDAAGVDTVTLTVSATAATDAANAASDAAAEAIDAANAATDAANLAAEAADAATVAAEEARDAADAATAAVEELATQVATLMAALKAQITTLANTVAKIAKKVKA